MRAVNSITGYKMERALYINSYAPFLSLNIKHIGLVESAETAVQE